MLPVIAIKAVQENAIPYDKRKTCLDSGTAAEVLRTYLEDEDREHFAIILLNSRGKAIGIHTVAIGSLDTTIVHPREVFKPAILMNASFIVCGHNHPSGDTEPSTADKAMTRQLVAAGGIIGIAVADHIIVSPDHGRYFSFRKYYPDLFQDKED